jgi:hypothetical protein
MSPQIATTFAITSSSDERPFFASVRADRDRDSGDAPERELPSENND